MIIGRLFLMFLALGFLAGCAETELISHIAKNIPGNMPPSGTFKVGNPYKVEGEWYRPTETYSYSETGIASWYGPGFQGKRTANGERFDKNELTAAHRTLQMPSFVRVTNLENGRSLVVRINDRGPFKRGRVIDLTQRAAELLGYANRGTAKVRLDLLVDESKAVAMAARRGESTRGSEVALNQSGQPVTGYQRIALQSPAVQPPIPGHVRNGNFLPDPVIGHEAVRPTGIYVQAGAFVQSANAGNFAREVAKFGRAQVFPAVVGGRQFFRVRLGPLATVEAADALLDRIERAGYGHPVIIVD